MCPKESCFPDCWKVPSVVPISENVGQRSIVKNYCPVSLLSVVIKVFEKFENNRIAEHPEICGIFSNFQYGFRSAQSIAIFWQLHFIALLGLLTGLGLLKLKHLKYPRPLREFGMLVFFTNLRISGQIFGLPSSFLIDTQLHVVLDGKSSQEYQVNAGVL